MITVEVITTKKPPIPIKVFIDNLASTNDILFTSKLGFSQKFILASGKYIIRVSGMNGKGGKTTVKLTGEFKEGPDPTSPQTTEDSFFLIPFKCEI